MDATMTLRGRVGTDLQTSRTKTGTLCVRFRLAVAQWRRTDSGEYEETGVRWYSIRAWGRLADYVLPSIRKGDPIIIIGRPNAHAWADPNGEIRTDLVFNAVAIGHDLNYGVTRFTKNGGTLLPAPTEEKVSEEASTQVDISTQATPQDSQFHITPTFDESDKELLRPSNRGVFDSHYPLEDPQATTSEEAA